MEAIFAIDKNGLKYYVYRSEEIQGCISLMTYSVAASNSAEDRPMKKLTITAVIMAAALTTSIQAQARYLDDSLSIYGLHSNEVVQQGKSIEETELTQDNIFKTDGPWSW